MKRYKQIYADYLLSRIVHRDVKDIAKHYGITRQHVYNIVRHEENRKVDGLQGVWNEKYGIMWSRLKELDIKDTKGLRRALLMEMRKDGYTKRSIARYTGLLVENIDMILEW